jgi:hypothetical protein
LFLLVFLGFSGFSDRLSAAGGESDDAKVETSHRPKMPMKASNCRRFAPAETSNRLDIKWKGADTRARWQEPCFRAAAPPVGR